MESAIAANVCAQLDESVFTLRAAIPLTWHGQAAEAFARDGETVVARLVATSQNLQAYVHLLRLHEQRMQTLGTSVGWTG